MTKVYYVVGDTEYKKADIKYCQLKSKERGVKVGDVRVIADEMIYCTGIYRDWDSYSYFPKPIVEWKLLKLIDLDSNSDDYYEQKKKIISDFYKKLHNDTY